MSKTAEEWTNQGDKHDDNNELEQAIECFDKAIAINPNYGRAYFLKSFVNEKQGVKTETLVELCRKALSLGYTTASCYENLGNYLMLLNQLEEAVQHLKKSFEIDNGRTNAISYAGKLLECLGRKTEAMACYDLCLTHHPGIFKPNYFKGNLLAEDGKFQESLQYYAIATSLSPLSAGCAYRYATALNAVGRKEEATQWYTRGSQTSVEASIDYCLRGQCHRILGHKESAMRDFKSAQEIVNAEKKEMLAPDFVNFIRATLKSVFEAEDAFAEVEAAVNNLDPNNSIAKKFTTSIKKLQEQKEKAQAKALSNIDKAPVAENRHAMSELDLLKEEFRKQLAEVQGEVKKIKSDVTKIEERVTKVEGAVEDLKEELNNKMDDFFKKLENELKKQDLSSEDIGKLKGYFKAFVETFSSIHVTSQVVDSGQVQLDSDSSVASVLSFAASFAPFIGNALATGVKSLGDFLKSKEMKTNARKLKRLAPDATQLSQIIGKSGYEILINKKKQEQILQVTTKESQNMTKSVFEKLVKLCDKMSESVDVYLYTDLYPTPSEKVGHSDANILIAKWIEGSILPGNIEEQFVEEILNPKLKEQLAAEQKIENGPVATRSGCCNLF